VVRLFFSPQGRIASGPFWRGVAIVLAANIALSVLQVFVLPRTVALQFSVVALALIYPWVCIYAKRFHDAGMSAWWVLAVMGGQTLVGVIVGMVLNAGAVADLQAAQVGTAQWQTLQVELGRRTFVPAQAVRIAVAVAVAFMVARLAADPDENRFGPPLGG